MSRLKTIAMNEASGEIKELYAAIEKKMGVVPNIFKGMACSPVLLKAYLQLEELVGAGTLSGAEQDVVRLVASQFNGCKYCLAAHTKTAGTHGLSDKEIIAIRRGHPQNEKHAALVTFVQRLLETKGSVNDAEIQDFRNAGYDDSQIGEVITLIGQKMISNIFNHVHETDVDFPEVEDL